MTQILMQVRVLRREESSGDELLGEKTFEADFSTLDPTRWFSNVVMWAALMLQPFADQLVLDKQQADLDARRRELAGE